MTDTPETLAVIRNLLESQKLAVLSTQNHGQPYCNLIAIAATEDLKYLLFATTRATRKYANLMADSRVAVLVDNRQNDAADFAEAAALTALGKAWEVQGAERQQFLTVYLGKHPYLEEFVTSPTCALLRIKVDKYIVVTRFQEVREIQIPA
ncbi:MAG: pyridoxamine 5'-phosphate oxidase family protein [Deltaproteobacteria bacterium]|nr:pyridoxamine 5'-phosphate oxidase family protein [Deltaproteobacteria bacterium]